MSEIKLHPKNIKFCPGCSKKDLKLNKPEQKFIIEDPNITEDTKNITILSKKPKKKQQFNSLF